MLEIKDITSCSMMDNSKYPEQQSLISSLKILLLSHHSPAFKIRNLSFNWGGPFVCFRINFVYFQMLMLPLVQNKHSSLFKNSSSFSIQIKSYLLYEVLLTFRTSSSQESLPVLKVIPVFFTSFTVWPYILYIVYSFIGLYLNSPSNNNKNTYFSEHLLLLRVLNIYCL